MNKLQLILKLKQFPVLLSIGSSLTAMILNYGITLLLTPYITSTLGTEAYGFVTLAKTVANYGIIVTSCFNAYASRYVAVSYHEGNLERANRYYSSVLLANIALLLVFAVGGFIFVQHLTALFAIPETLLRDVKLLFFLDILNCVGMTVGATFSISACVKDKIYLLGFTKIVIYSAEAVILVLLFALFAPKVYYVGIGLLGSTVLGNCLYFGLKQKLSPELRCRPAEFSWRAVRELLGRGFWNSLNQVGNLLNSGLDLWVTNLLLSGLRLGQLSIVKTVYSIFTVLTDLIKQPYQAKLFAYYAQGSRDAVLSTLKMEMKIMGLVASLLTAGFYTFGEAYFALWIPGADAGFLQQLTMLTLVGFCVEALACPLYEVYTLTLKNRLPCIVTVLTGLCNVALMWILLHRTNLGLFAVVGTTTVLAYINCGIFTPLYASHCLNCSPKQFYPTIFRALFSVLVLTAVTAFLFGHVVVDSWLKLMGFTLLTCCICVPLYLLIMLSARERKYLMCNVFLGKHANM